MSERCRQAHWVVGRIESRWAHWVLGGRIGSSAGAPRRVKSCRSPCLQNRFGRIGSKCSLHSGVTWRQTRSRPTSVKASRLVRSASAAQRPPARAERLRRAAHAPHRTPRRTRSAGTPTIVRLRAVGTQSTGQATRCRRSLGQTAVKSSMFREDVVGSMSSPSADGAPRHLSVDGMPDRRSLHVASPSPWPIAEMGRGISAPHAHSLPPLGCRRWVAHSTVLDIARPQAPAR